MKKAILILISVLFVVALNAQTKTLKFDVTRKQLKEAKNFSDIAPGVSPDCKVKSCKFGMVNAGKISEFVLNGNFLALPENISKLEKIFIQDIKSDCKEITGVKYVFAVKPD